MSDALLRSAPFTLARDATDGEPGDGNTLEGYAAVFDSPTRIDSWEGTFDESIARGAFKKSIRENTPVLQFDHGRHPMVGSIPLGALEACREDAQGLYVKAALHDNWLVEPVRDAIASRAIDGMSFRFQVVKDEWRDAKGNILTDPSEIQRLLYTPDKRGVLQRTLKEVRCLELGPVVFPAYKGTSVDVRSEHADMLRAMFATPEARAEVARLLLTSTPATSEDEGSSAATGAASSITTEPGEPLRDEDTVTDGARRAAAHARHRRALLNGIHNR